MDPPRCMVLNGELEWGKWNKVLEASTTLTEGPVVPREVAFPPLVATLLALCQGYLARAGGVRDMAGACLGRLLARPDCAGALAAFVAWARPRLQSTGPEAVFLIPGACMHLFCGTATSLDVLTVESPHVEWAALGTSWLLPGCKSPCMPLGMAGFRPQRV